MAICSSPSSSSSSSLSSESSNNNKAWILHGIFAGVAIAAAVGARTYFNRFNKFRSRVIGIIPARFASSRFQGKPLVHILGKPMIQVRHWRFHFLFICSESNLFFGNCFFFSFFNLLIFTSFLKCCFCHFYKSNLI